ncbi:MAG: hypothetical protein ACLUOI_37135 [Eisenbergiella sp.]
MQNVAPITGTGGQVLAQKDKLLHGEGIHYDFYFGPESKLIYAVDKPTNAVQARTLYFEKGMY